MLPIATESRVVRFSTHSLGMLDEALTVRRVLSTRTRTRNSAKNGTSTTRSRSGGASKISTKSFAKSAGER